MTEPTYELVRVSREIVEQLTETDSEPVVLVGIQRRSDGTCDMFLKTPPRLVPLDAVVEFLWANNSKVAAAKVSAEFGVSGALKGTEEEPSP